MTRHAHGKQSSDDREDTANRKEQSTAARSQSADAQQSQQRDAVPLLKADHRKVEQLFAKFESAGSGDEKRELAKKICNELIVHSTLEEEIFYPACRKKNVEDDILDEAQAEHDSAKVLIAGLMNQDPDAPYYEIMDEASAAARGAAAGSPTSTGAS